MGYGKTRPMSHIKGEQGVKILKEIFPASWVVREYSPDYGIDLDVKTSDQIKIGGFIIENKANNVVIDESLDFALENQKDWFYKTSGLMIK